MEAERKSRKMYGWRRMKSDAHSQASVIINYVTGQRSEQCRLLPATWEGSKVTSKPAAVHHRLKHQPIGSRNQSAELQPPTL